MRLPLVTTCLLVLILTAGCERRMALTPGHPPRSPVTGDNAKYTVEAVNGTNDAIGFGNDTSAKVTVEAGTKHADAVPSGIVRTYDIRNVSSGIYGSRTVFVWYGEDAQNNSYLLGMRMNGQVWDLVTDTTLPMICPGSLDVGMRWEYVAHLASGMTITSAEKVVGTEWLSTDAGEFETYKVEQNLTVDDGSSFGPKVNITGFIWVSPQVNPLSIKSELNADIKGVLSNDIGQICRKLRLKELNVVE